MDGHIGARLRAVKATIYQFDFTRDLPPVNLAKWEIYQYWNFQNQLMCMYEDELTEQQDNHHQITKTKHRRASSSSSSAAESKNVTTHRRRSSSSSSSAFPHHHQHHSHGSSSDEMHEDFSVG